MSAVRIIGSGTYLPGNPLTIDQVDDVLGRFTGIDSRLQKWLDRNRTLMKEMLEVERYHYAIDPLTGRYTDDTITMAVKASRKALEMASLDASDIDFIAYGSAHQHQMPTASVRIQEQLGLPRCAEVSVHANCTSAYKAFQIAFDQIRLGRYRTALVVSSGISSSELRADYYNPQKITKEHLFLRYILGDGAGAIILQANGATLRGDVEVREVYTESVGGDKPAGMSNMRPAWWMNPQEEFEAGAHHLSQLLGDQLQQQFFSPEGSVFYQGLQRMLDKCPIETRQVSHFQVNFPSKHIAETVLDECIQLGFPAHSWYTRLANLGYPGPPMVFICIDHILRNEPLQPGRFIVSFVTEVSKFMQAGYILEIK